MTRRRKKSGLPRPMSLDALGLLGGDMLAYHEELREHGFRLAAKADARPRVDGSWRVRFVWRKRDGDCSVVISRSVRVPPEVYSGTTVADA